MKPHEFILILTTDPNEEEVDRQFSKGKKQWLKSSALT